MHSFYKLSLDGVFLETALLFCLLTGDLTPNAPMPKVKLQNYESIGASLPESYTP